MQRIKQSQIHYLTYQLAKPLHHMARPSVQVNTKRRHSQGGHGYSEYSDPDCTFDHRITAWPVSGDHVSQLLLPERSFPSLPVMWTDGGGNLSSAVWSDRTSADSIIE